jgi:hypothetical protein
VQRLQRFATYTHLKQVVLRMITEDMRQRGKAPSFSSALQVRHVVAGFVTARVTLFCATTAVFVSPCNLSSVRVTAKGLCQPGKALSFNCACRSGHVCFLGLDNTAICASLCCSSSRACPRVSFAWSSALSGAVTSVSSCVLNTAGTRGSGSPQCKFA